MGRVEREIGDDTARNFKEPVRMSYHGFFIGVLNTINREDDCIV
jgi:hypothetical protein